MVLKFSRVKRLHLRLLTGQKEKNNLFGTVTFKAFDPGSGAGRKKVMKRCPENTAAKNSGVNSFALH